MQGKAEYVGSKETKPIPAPPHGARLKSRPIFAPPPLRDGENPCGIKRGEAKLPSPKNTIYHFGIHNIDKRP